MQTNNPAPARRRPSPLGMFYVVVVFMLTLSGFAQMPIFKRYYIADIPGLGWLADFFATHYLHYLFASFFIALVSYAIADHFIHMKKKDIIISRSGLAKIFLLAALTGSGGFLVVKNLRAFIFPPALILAFDLVHLCLVMILLLFSAYTLIKGKRWIEESRTARINEDP